MKITLINPPNCGRSIPEEEFGITSLKMIFRGEPLALETLAGNLDGHDVRIIDLKAAPDSFGEIFQEELPAELICFTAVTCEANTIIALAQKIKDELQEQSPLIAVGGHHASLDPSYFNRGCIDYVVVGLGKLSFRQLVDSLSAGDDDPAIPGIAKTRPGKTLNFSPRHYGLADLVDHKPPRYDLVESHRDQYVMGGVGGKVGFVSTAFGCTHCCSFCSIPSMTGGRYLNHSIESIIRDIGLLGDISLIRFVDANTFGTIAMARPLAQKIIELKIRKKFVADIRADTVVRNPELMQLWKKAGLDAVVIGCEEIDDDRLNNMNKKSSLQANKEALNILSDIGIRVIGDFIISPDYDYKDFDRLAKFIDNSTIALPIPSILTPLPGTKLFKQVQDHLEITDLDYYTFSNAVLPTKLEKKEFYTLYSDLMKHLHQHINK